MTRHRLPDSVLIDHLPDAVVLVGSDGRIRNANSRCLESFGYEKGELLGQPVEKLMPERFHRQHTRQRLAYATNPHTRTMGTGLDLRAERKGGEEFPVDIMLGMVPTAAGKLACAVIRDISEQKRISEQLERKNREYRRLIDNLPGYVYRCDNNRDWTVRFISQQIESIVGLKPDDLIDSDVVAFGDLVHPDDREWVWTLEQECLAEHKPCELQYRLVTPAGIVKWVWDRSEGIYDEKGTVVGLEGYCEDITAFKQQEQVLHSMNQNLEKQINENRELAIANAMDKEKYKRLIDNLPGYVYKSNCDEKWTIQSRSKGVENLFEISLEKTAEKNDINIGDLMHPDDRERVWHSARAAIACRRPYEAQYRIITASGVEKWVWERAQGVYDADGNVIYIEGYIEDITSMKRREIELSDARAKAEAAVRAKSAFIANINHEIRTPLNAIVGFSELIAAERLGPLGNSAYREFAQHIRNSAGSLLAIVNTIMDLNRIQSGDASPDIQVIDPGEVVASLVRLWKAHAADRGITVEFHNAAGGSRLRTDEQHLHKIVDNLLSNAVKFTHENGSVHVSLRLDNHRRIVLGVNDDGIGMYPEHVAKVTEAFFQINNDINRSTGGIGLGLTLVSAYVKLHGAALNIDSTPGKGTCIEVTFPTTATVGEAAASLSRRSKLATARPQH